MKNNDGGRRVYHTITGRALDLSGISAEDAAFLNEVTEKFRACRNWTTFSSFWFGLFNRRGFKIALPVYRVCQDLEARLGIAEGKVAPPDYRDYLADFINEKYGSYDRFCEETGTDMAQLSRAFSGRPELSLDALRKILHGLHLVMVLQPEEELLDRAAPEEAMRELDALWL